jgi:hypothetical protein
MDNSNVYSGGLKSSEGASIALSENRYTCASFDGIAINTENADIFCSDENVESTDSLVSETYTPECPSIYQEDIDVDYENIYYEICESEEVKETHNLGLMAISSNGAPVHHLSENARDASSSKIFASHKKTLMALSKTAITSHKKTLNDKKVIMKHVVPQLIFIVPYRDRQQELNQYLEHMKTLLMNIPRENYEICIVHQKDKRAFNRGAIKNIGFILSKNKYPQDYQKITFVFHDIDVLPMTLPSFGTTRNTIKHFYGFNYGLGGLFSITGFDFEKINGFPNYWGWGFEDNYILKSAIQNNMYIDRSEFTPFQHYTIEKCICNRSPCICLLSKQINPNQKYLHSETSHVKIICIQNIMNYVKNVREGISNIQNLQTSETKESFETYYDVTLFTLNKPCVDYANATFEEYNILNGPYKIPQRMLRGSSMKMFFDK